jgi:hypothetical protein
VIVLAFVLAGIGALLVGAALGYAYALLHVDRHLAELTPEELVSLDRRVRLRRSQRTGEPVPASSGKT